jgi:DNA-binding MarR family transcriptional regulator
VNAVRSGTVEKLGVARFATSELAQETEFLLARARAAGTGLANSRLLGLGLKARSYAVLSLAASGLEPTQRELAEFLSLDASQIVALVDHLEKENLVERRPAPSDRRTNVIVATTSGKQIYARARDVARETEGESLSVLTVSEREELRRLLSKITL